MNGVKTYISIFLDCFDHHLLCESHYNKVANFGGVYVGRTSWWHNLPKQNTTSPSLRFSSYHEEIELKIQDILTWIS